MMIPQTTPTLLTEAVLGEIFKMNYNANEIKICYLKLLNKMKL